MAVIGDFKRLDALVLSAKLLPRELKRSGRVNRALAEEVMNQIVEGFEEQRDPYGTPWKKTRRGGAILRDTGRLLNSRSYDMTDTGFKVSFASAYAATHQFGAVIKPKRQGKKARLRFTVGRGRKGRVVFAKQVKIPKRPFMPTPKQGLGLWKEPMEQAGEAAIRVVMRARKKGK